MISSIFLNTPPIYPITIIVFLVAIIGLLIFINKNHKKNLSDNLQFEKTSGIFTFQRSLAGINNFFKNLPLGVVVFDQNQNLIQINDAFSKISGLNQQQLEWEIGTDLLNFAKYCNINPNTFRDLQAMQAVECTGEILNIKTREHLNVKIFGQPISYKSNRNWYVIMLLPHKSINLTSEERPANDQSSEKPEDLSERVRDLERAFKKSSIQHIKLQKALYENEIQRQKLQEAFDLINHQKEQLERANAEIKEQTRMKELFLANTSHEIRTPLNAIIGFTNLLLKEPLHSHQLEYLKNIKASSDNLLVVLNGILDISKIEAGKMTFEKIPFLIYELIEILINTVEIKAQEKEHDIVCDIDTTIPPVLVGDPTRLNQILLNLLSNAIKFTPNKGQIICKSRVKEKKGNTIVIEFMVKDNGIGMTPEQIPLIFNAFTQAEYSTTRKYGGTGLGLSIVKNLVELQDGEIFVDSAPNIGTTFTFYLPFGIGELSEIKPKEKKEVTLLQHEAANISILLVEDNKINQQLAIDTIHSWHKEIAIDLAENGVEALEKLKVNNYSMIFMDIQMPVLDGIETTRRIRQGAIKGKDNIPIIAMTAHALKEEKDKCLAAGMNDYLVKPFVPEDLFQRIKDYGNQKIQIMVKSGEIIPVNMESFGHDNHSNSIQQPTVSLNNPFKSFTISPLLTLYKGNITQIDKILKMYYDTVGKEIEEMSLALEKNDLEKVQIRAHSLKPKMSYIGRNDLHNLSKEIEQSIKQKNYSPEELIKQVNTIVNEWKAIDSELAHYFSQSIKA
ncbi:MAG TPA: ATP-binding protein [Salinivirgaceae bacterium]|nr:ATP-binding protein [Salinivirgaceae bacterium]